MNILNRRKLFPLGILSILVAFSSLVNLTTNVLGGAVYSTLPIADGVDDVNKHTISPYALVDTGDYIDGIDIVSMNVFGQVINVTFNSTFLGPTNTSTSFSLFINTDGGAIDNYLLFYYGATNAGYLYRYSNGGYWNGTEYTTGAPWTNMTTCNGKNLTITIPGAALTILGTFTYCAVSQIIAGSSYIYNDYAPNTAATPSSSPPTTPPDQIPGYIPLYLLLGIIGGVFIVHRKNFQK